MQGDSGEAGASGVDDAVHGAKNALMGVEGAMDDAFEGVEGAYDDAKETADDLAAATRILEFSMTFTLAGENLRSAGSVARRMKAMGFRDEEINLVVKLVYHVDTSDEVAKAVFKLFLGMDDFQEVYDILMPSDMTAEERKAFVRQSMGPQRPGKKQEMQYAGLIDALLGLHAPQGDRRRALAVERLKVMEEEDEYAKRDQNRLKARVLRTMGAKCLKLELGEKIASWRLNNIDAYKLAAEQLQRTMANMVEGLAPGDLNSEAMDILRQRKLREDKDAHANDVTKQIEDLKDEYLKLNIRFEAALTEGRKKDVRVADAEREVQITKDDARRQAMTQPHSLWINPVMWLFVSGARSRGGNDENET